MTQRAPHTQWTTPEKVALFLSLIAYLQQHGATEVSELALRFNVSPALVRKMVRFIGTAGIPGDSHSYSHQDLYDIDWDALELDDIAQLKQVVGVDGTPRFTSMQAAAIFAGLHSMRALLTPEQAEVAASAEAKLRLATIPDEPTLSVGHQSEPFAHELALIRTSISSNEQLAFAYFDRDAQVSRRRIDPHRIVQFQGAWYFEGWCHHRQAVRTFRLEFVSELEQLHEPQRHPQPEAAPMHQQPEASAQVGTDVELLIDREAVHRVGAWNPRLIGHASRDRVRVSVTLIHESRIIELVCVAPGLIEVVAPAQIRALVSDWAESKT